MPGSASTTATERSLANNTGEVVTRAYPNDRDGTYLARLKPGRYVVYVYLRTASTVDFTTPDVGDDATDSDIVTSIREYWAPRGLSAVVEVRDGSESVVDFGLVPIE